MSAYIALGGNQPAMYAGKYLKPRDCFHKALKLFDNFGIKVQTVSNLWRSPAWPDPGTQPAYSNAVAKVKTSLPPDILLANLQQIERHFGRKPAQKNAPRPLDLDILDYRQEKLETNALVLPHPRMCDRSFVLFPLYEIAPNWHDPIYQRSISDWMSRLALKEVQNLYCLGPFL